jgi:hypothetical protein
MPVLVGVVDQADVPPDEGFVEPLVLEGRHHPAPIDGSDRLNLLGHPSHDTSGVVAPDQGVVIDEDVTQPEPLNGSDLGLERPIGSGWFQWVSAQYEEHGEWFAAMAIVGART